ncbi:hypothetical protein HZ994_17920 [Akkermansiaceae bacterium]|nr:hypothetical protein HZ994_17920 [Akkermansiaceae bacterium]
MTQGKRYMVLAAAVLAMGAVRMPFEKGLDNDLRASGLLPPRLEVRTSDRIGQTFFAVSLGGMRTLVATIWNLRAFGFFNEQKWEDIEECYDLIVDLAPRTRYYWDTGSWHQAYNEASYYLYDSTLPALRRKQAWKDSILSGRAFLERGIRNNPGDSVLWERLGYLLSDSNKISAFGDPAKAYQESYDAYMTAVEMGNSRALTSRFALYSLARVPGREKEALAMARRLHAEQNANTATMLSLLYTLGYHEDPAQPVDKLIDSVFPSREKAYEILTGLWERTRDRYPVYGVAQAITFLESELKVPPAESVLKRELLPPMSPEDYFRQEE